MPEEDKNPKKDGEQTPNQPGSADEKNGGKQGDDTPPKTDADLDDAEKNKEPEMISVSKNEYEKISKKATDFDGIIEKQRIEKLSKKEEKQPLPSGDGVKPEDLARLVDEAVDKRMAGVNKTIYEDNLGKAYKDFIKDHPWANSDEIIGSISEKFSPDSTLTADQLKIKLERVAEDIYPDQVKKAREDKIKSDLALQDQKLKAGDLLGGSSDKTEKKSDEQKPKKFFIKSQPVQEWYKKDK